MIILVDYNLTGYIVLFQGTFGDLTCVTERRDITNRCSGKIERLYEDVKLDKLPPNPIVGLLKARTNSQLMLSQPKSPR